MIEPRDKRSDDPRSYYVKKDVSGEVLLRNRRHFKKLPEKPEAAVVSAPASPVEAPAGPKTHAEPEVCAEPRTRSEHACADSESLQPDMAEEEAHHVQRLTAGHGESPESREQHVCQRPGVLTAVGDVGQYRPPDAIASLQCRSRRSTKWSD